MENKNIYNLKKIRNFLENPNVNLKINESIDLLLLFISTNDIKQQMYAENLSPSKYIVKVAENTEEYGTIISFNKKDYVLSSELEELIEKTAPKELKDFIKKELILFTYNAYSILDVSDPVFWLDFVKNYLSRLIYGKHFKQLRFSEVDHIAEVVEYLCLQFVSYFEILKSPFVFIDEKDDHVLLGYFFNNALDSHENEDVNEKNKNHICIFVKKIGATLEKFSYDVLKEPKYSNFIPGMKLLLEKKANCNIFIVLQGKEYAKENLCLYQILLKSLLILSFELEFVYKNNSNNLRDAASFDLLKSKEEVELYREIVENEYYKIIAYIIKIIYKYKIIICFLFFFCIYILFLL